MRELLAPLPMPVHVLPGNHDDRAAMRARFPLEGDGEYRYVDRRRRRAAGRLRLDGPGPRRRAGSTSRWLEAQLDAPRSSSRCTTRRSASGCRRSTRSRSARTTARARRAAGRNPQVLRVLCGHTHRAAFAVVGGCGAFTCPGVHLTARLEIGAPGYEVVAEPPAFALHVPSAARSPRTSSRSSGEGSARRARAWRWRGRMRRRRTRRRARDPDHADARPRPRRRGHAAPRAAAARARAAARTSRTAARTSGRIVYVERVDPDGDGDLHVVVTDRRGVTLRGLTAIDVSKELRPRRDPRVGERAAAMGPVQTGSYGQSQIHALVFRTRR